MTNTTNTNANTTTTTTILIMYYSRTGHTKALAAAIADGVNEVEGATAVVKPCEEVTSEDFVAADGIIAGSPVYFGVMAAPLKEVFDRFVTVRSKMGDTIGAAFATSADPSGGKETTIMSILQCFLIYGMIVVGDPLDATGHYGVACTGAPDEQTHAHAAKLGARVAALARTVGTAMDRD